MSIYNWFPAGNGKAALAGIGAFLVLMVILLLRCSHAHAADEIDFGAGAGIAHGSGGAIDLSYHHDLPFSGSEPPRLFIGTLMHAADGLGDPNNWAWFGGIEAQRGFLHAGVGAAYLQRVDSLNGSHTDYALFVSYRRFKWCPLTVYHFSDAGTTPVNTGRNILVCEWQLR